MGTAQRLLARLEEISVESTTFMPVALHRDYVPLINHGTRSPWHCVRSRLIQ